MIVSLTSHPKRFSILPQALHRLSNQTVLPSLIIVNIDRRFMSDIPPLFAGKGAPIDVFPIDDLGPASKLIPTISRFPEETVVTLDDDVIYRPTQLEALTSHSKKNPGAVIAGLARLIPFFPLARRIPYTMWPVARTSQSSQHNEMLLPLGAEGVLYPPNSLHPDVFDVPLLRRIAYSTDDLWFWAQRVRAGSPLECLPIEQRQDRVEGSDATGLWRRNRVSRNRKVMAVLIKMLEDEGLGGFGNNFSEWAKEESTARISRLKRFARTKVFRNHGN